jgi:hypothetical protein
VIVLLLGDYIRGKRKWLRATIMTVFAAVAFLTILGFGELAGWGLAARVIKIWNGAMNFLGNLLPQPD